MKTAKICLLNKRQWRENYRGYGIGLLAITGILLFLFVMVWHWRDSFSGDTHRGIFLMGLFAGGALFGSSLFKDLQQPAKGIWMIGLPAASIEKVIIAIGYAILVYLTAYLVIFYVTEGFFLWIIKREGALYERTDLLHNGFYNFAFTFVNFQLLILLGCLFFRKAALIKTILVMILYFSVFYNGNNYLLMLITGERSINGGAIYDYFQFTHQGENVYVHLPQNISTVVNFFFNYMIPVTLCYIIYQKFRETEI